MKTILTFVVSLMAWFKGPAQTFSEWFKQKKTQLKYSARQIATLAIYAKTVERGYEIVQDGLLRIRDAKEGDFEQHSGYFKSLNNVNKNLRNDAICDACTQYVISLFQQSKLIEKEMRAGGQFTDEECELIERALARLVMDCLNDAEEVEELTNKGTFQLQDEERLSRIEFLRAQLSIMSERLQFMASDIRILGAQRRKDKSDIESLLKIYQFN